MAASLSPHQAGLDSGLGITARDTGTALVIVAANIILSARTGLTSGLAPVTLSAVTLAVVSGYGGATPARTLVNAHYPVSLPAEYDNPPP